MTEDHHATAGNDGPSPTPATLPGVGSLARHFELPPSTLERRLWWLVVAGFLADTVLTIYGVHAGHVEGNPVMRHALASLGIVGIVGLKSGAIAVAVACRPLLSEAHRPLVPAALSLPWIAAALVNVVVVFG